MMSKKMTVEEQAVLRVVSQLPGAVVLLSADEFRVKYMSDAYRSYLPKAFKDKDLVGTRFVDYSADGEKNPVIPILRRISESGKGEEVMDFRTRNRDGAEFWVDWIGSPIDNGTDKWDVLVQISDITERKRAEGALEKSLQEKEFFEFSVVNSSQPFASGTIDGRLVYFNKAFEKLTGYAKEELKDLTWMTDLTPSKYREFEAEQLSRLMETGEPVRYEKEYLRKDGGLVPIELYVHLFRDTEGTPLYYCSFINDLTERKKAEKALKQANEELEQRVQERTKELSRSEERFRTLSDATFEGIVVHDEGIILDVNQTALDQTGYSREEVIGRSILDFFLPESQSLIRKIVQQPVVEAYEAHLKKKNEELRTVQIRARAMESDGRPVRVATIMDITDRKQAEEALEGERKRLKEILDQMPVGVTIIEAPNGRISYQNEEVSSLFRHELFPTSGIEEYEKWQVFNLDETPVKTGEHPIALSLLKGVVIRNKEEMILRGDGTHGFLSTTSAPIRDWNGKIVAAVGVNVDVTERMEAEKALKESESKYRGLFENMIDAVSIHKHVYDDQGNVIERIIVDANPVALEALGVSSLQEALGKPDTELYGPKLAVEYCRQCNLMRSTGRPIVAESRSPDGRREYISAFVSLGDNHFIVISHDVTELKKTQNELNRSNAELQQFANIVSHDLKGPLSTIIGFLALLEGRYKGKLLDEKAEKYVRNAIEGAERMGRLIDDLFDLSGVDRKGKSFEIVNMNEVLSLMEQNLDRAIRESNANITNDPLPSVMADSVQMMELLQNLIANAIKFRRPHEPPRIHISASSTEGEWTFSVKDSGIGIPKEQQERIFQMFQRLHTEQEYPGTGIGLAIVKKIVDRHGGRIWVESEVGKGSTFYFTIPRDNS